MYTDLHDFFFNAYICITETILLSLNIDMISKQNIIVVFHYIFKS